MSEELKPCPFCGGEASFCHVVGSYGYYPSKTGVQCGNGDCLVQPKIAFVDEEYDWDKRAHVRLDSKAQAIAAWNHRTTPDLAEAARVAVEKLARLQYWLDADADTLAGMDAETLADHKHMVASVADIAATLRTALDAGGGK